LIEDASAHDAECLICEARKPLSHKNLVPL
jgi:hypothetical protein